MQNPDNFGIEPPVDPHKFDSWNALAVNLGYVFLAMSALIALAYIIRLNTIGGDKKKYDFINRHEIKWLWAATIVFLISMCLFGNSGIENMNPVLFFVRSFVTIAFGLILGLIVQNLLKFYYPFYIEKRLKLLRFKPRISPKTGKPMRLLSEEEEDAYLDEGMQAEENVFSVDYDVWIDEESGYTQIEKYAGHLHAIQCPECNYQTFKVVKEEITKAPSTTSEGEVIKHYLCGYCGYKAKKAVVLKQQTSKVEQATA
jgi:DNA-directed RNA polymerase subunit RPC12/RpoP